ncbi:MAG: hypothetical protein PBU42_03810 [Acinetobacter haemolyticus]
MISRDELKKIAVDFRNALDQVTSGFIVGNFSKFPKECGADACDLLQHYLWYNYEIKTEYHTGKVQVSSRSLETLHCYLVANGIIIDITADQFNKEQFPKVIACESNTYPLLPYFKYVRTKGDEQLGQLNSYQESIYKKVLECLSK